LQVAVLVVALGKHHRAAAVHDRVGRAQRIGQVSNLDHSNQKLGKAGRNRWKGKRPAVRGSVMTPRDHPHGVGEGKSPIGLPGPKSPWGKPTLGKKTRNSPRTDRWIVRRRNGR